jgi:hypothetical protein
VRDWICEELTTAHFSEIIRIQNKFSGYMKWREIAVEMGFDFERIQKQLVLEHATTTGDVRGLQQWVCLLEGSEFGPQLAKFIQPLPLTRGKKYPAEQKLEPNKKRQYIERDTRLHSAKAMVPLIRKLLKEHTGSSRLPNADHSYDIASIAAHYYGVDPAAVRQKPSGRHKKPRKIISG